MSTNPTGITHSSLLQDILSPQVSNNQPRSHLVVIEHFMRGTHICTIEMFESDTIEDVRDKLHDLYNVYLCFYMRRDDEELSDDTTLGALEQNTVTLYALNRRPDYCSPMPRSVIPSPLIHDLWIASG